LTVKLSYPLRAQGESTGKKFRVFGEPYYFL
jgi:hypothetical protein